MATHFSHAALPYCIKGARYTLPVPYLDADGDPTDPTTPDTEVSKDGGAYADCAEEVTTITGSNGSGYITLSGAETDASMLMVAAKVASGPKATLLATTPRNLPIVGSGTLSAGSAGGGTLGTILAYDVTGCFIKTTGGTGGGGAGGANNQARRMITYTASTGAFTVSPNWETTPDGTTTYDVLLPEGMTLGAIKALNPTTAGRTLDVSATGEADANTVQWLGTACATPTVAGVPEVDLTHIGGDAQSGTDLKDFADAGYDPATNKVQGVVLVDTVTTLTGHTAQTGDSYALANGANGFVAIKGDTAAILVDTGTTLDGRIPAALVGGRMDVSVGAMANDVITAASMAASASTEIRSLVSGTADSGTTTTMVDAARTEADADYWDENHIIVFTSGTISGQARVITGFDPATDTITFAPATTQAVGTNTYEIWPVAAALRPTVHGRTLDVSAGGEAGMDWANVGGQTTAVTLSGTTVNDLTTKTDFRLSTAGVNDILRTALTEGYAADGAAFTLEQFAYMLWSALTEFAISGTTITAKKLDGVATAGTWTLNDGTNPTSRTRAT